MSLLNGQVDITPKKDAAIDPIQLLKATYDSGVSVAEMTMVARGKIVKDPSGGIALEVQPGQSFAFLANHLSAGLANMVGRIITIRGLLYKKPDKKKKDLPGSLSITVLEIQQKE